MYCIREYVQTFANCLIMFLEQVNQQRDALGAGGHCHLETGPLMFQNKTQPWKAASTRSTAS